jgi:hypothetical protein
MNPIHDDPKDKGERLSLAARPRSNEVGVFEGAFDGHGLTAVFRAAGPVSFRKNVKIMARAMP